MVGLYAKRFTLPRKYQALLRPESPLQSEVRRTGASITQVPRREMTRGRPDEPILGSTFEVFVVGSRDAIVRAAGRIERCVRAAWGGARVVLANSGDAKPRRSSSGQQARVDVTAFENRREDGRRAARTRVRDSQGQPPRKRSRERTRSGSPPRPASRRRRSRSPRGDGNKQARSMLPSPLSSCPPAAQSKSQPLPHANRPWQPMQRQQQQQQRRQQDKQIATRTPSTAGQNENRDDLSQQMNPRTLQGKHFIELLTDSDSDCDQSISQSESELDIACDLCGRYDGEDSMILCDGCDAGFHIYCLDPPLSAIPRGDWFCQSCNPALNELKNSSRQKHEEVDRTRKWTNEEDARLASLMDDTSFTSWPARASALGTGRTPNAVYKRWQRYLSMQPENGEARGGRAHSPRTSVSLPKPSPAEKSRDLNNRTWTDEEDARLCSLMKDTSVTGWAARAEALGTGRTTRAVHTRWYRHLSARQEGGDARIAESQMDLNDSLPKPSSPKPTKSTSVGSAQADKSRDVNNRTWTDEEDARLCSLMKDTSVTGWAARAEALGTGRTTRAVHTRWYRHLSTKQQSDKDQATQSHKSLDTLSPKPNPIKLSKTKNLRYPLGTRVVARWLDRKHWYAGVISRVNLDGSRDVFYDDGEEELGVKLRNIQEESVATPDLIDDTDNTSSDRAAAHDSSSSDGACYTEGALVLSPADAASLESADKAKVDTVVSCTGCDTESAIALLNKCMWVVESAVTRWFDRPVRLQAGTGVGRFKPSDVPASLWSTNGERQVTRGVWAPIRCSVFSGRSREASNSAEEEQVYPVRKDVTAETLRALEKHEPYSRVTFPNRQFQWIDVEEGEMPPPSTLCQGRVPAISRAWRHAKSAIRRKIAHPLKRVVIGKLSSPSHPSVKYGGIAGAYGLFAKEAIKKGERIGYYAGGLLMSEEMDEDADRRQDGRYAIDFPLPPSTSALHERDGLVVDASIHRNEMSFMNDFRDEAFAPPPPDGHIRTPNVELCPTWEDFRVGDQDYQFPTFICEARLDIAKGRELLWDYGQAYWSQLAENMRSPKASQRTHIASP